jgi:hypothetical protein
MTAMTPSMKAAICAVTATRTAYQANAVMLVAVYPVYALTFGCPYAAWMA